MALTDDAVLVPAVGHYWYAATVGQARPTDPLAPTTPWVDLGHTSLDKPFGITSNGGDKTTLGTWQNTAVRSTYKPRIESITFELKQWDEQSLKLYYGSNATIGADGSVQVPASAIPTAGALYVIVQDGAEQVLFYWPSVEIFRADDISFDAENLAGLPVEATILGTSGQDWLYEVSPKADAGVTSIAVTPATSSKAVGSTTQLAVTATESDSSTRDVTDEASYTTSDASIATVSTTGLITMVATGSATITATYSGKTGSCAVTVT